VGSKREGQTCARRGRSCQYFHLIGNGKHRIKKMIFQLKQDEGTIMGDDNLNTIIL
jgi:hypothetical protein